MWSPSSRCHLRLSAPGLISSAAHPIPSECALHRSLVRTDRSSITLDPKGGSTIDGDRAEATRAKQIFGLLSPLASILPSTVTLHFSDHDLGSWLLADDQRKLIKNALQEGRYLSEAELKPYEKRLNRVEVKGIASACSEDSPAWQRSLQKQRGEPLSDLFESKGERTPPDLKY